MMRFEILMLMTNLYYSELTSSFVGICSVVEKREFVMALVLYLLFSKQNKGWNYERERCRNCWSRTSSSVLGIVWLGIVGYGIVGHGIVGPGHGFCDRSGKARAAVTLVVLVAIIGVAGTYNSFFAPLQFHAFLWELDSAHSKENIVGYHIMAKSKFFRTFLWYPVVVKTCACTFLTLTYLAF